MPSWRAAGGTESLFQVGFVQYCFQAEQKLKTKVLQVLRKGFAITYLFTHLIAKFDALFDPRSFAQHVNLNPSD